MDRATVGRAPAWVAPIAAQLVVAARRRPVPVAVHRLAQAVAHRPAQAAARRPVLVAAHRLAPEAARTEAARAAGHTRLAEPAANTPAALRQNPGRPWRRMDSYPRASQSERDPQQVPRSRLDLEDRDSKQVAAERRKQGAGAAVVATAELAVARTAAGRAPVVVPKQAPAALERAGERRKPAEELPRRPADCRKTGRICWWAGSSRRTACTRSCEKLPSSS